MVPIFRFPGSTSPWWRACSPPGRLSGHCAEQCRLQRLPRRTCRQCGSIGLGQIDIAAPARRARRADHRHGHAAGFRLCQPVRNARAATCAIHRWSLCTSSTTCFPNFSALDNVAMPLLIRREKGCVALAKAQAILKRVGLAMRAWLRAGR